MATSECSRGLQNFEPLATAILLGLLDHGLPELIDAINARNRAITQLRTEEALVRLSLKDRVRFADTAKPQYPRGPTGESHEFYGDAVVLCLDTPVGRFTSGDVRSPPELLEPIEGT